MAGTWVVPTLKIDGMSVAETAFRVSGDGSYVLEFELAGIHPLNASTIYATVTVLPPRKPEGDFREHYFLKGMYSLMTAAKTGLSSAIGLGYSTSMRDR
jgi:hypothetical protein